jgi:hypothetical protein
VKRHRLFWHRKMEGGSAYARKHILPKPFKTDVLVWPAEPTVVAEPDTREGGHGHLGVPVVCI